MVILAALVIRTITGDNDLIGTTTDSAENYKVTEYKEIISQTIAAQIQKNMMQGEGTSLNDIKAALEEKNDIKTANVYEDETIQNSDILVTTVEGYVIQVYYNDMYNVFYVEYIGKGNETDFPSLSADYKKVNDQANISASASISSGNIKQIEITKSGEVIARSNGEDIQGAEVTESGWYQVKAESTKGKLRYAWVRVTSVNQEFETPIITVSDGERGAGDWYRQNLKIKIASTDEGASKIYYMLNNVNTTPGSEEGTWQTAEGSEVEIPIETEGRTTVIAYASDETGKNTSEHISYTAKLDSTPPTINELQITGTEDIKNDWYTSDITVQVSGGDTESGINGYWYYLNGSTTGIYQSDLSKPVTITTEGTTRLKAQIADKAGNLSQEKEVSIKIDKTAPVFPNGIKTSKITETEMTIEALATDSVSGGVTYKCSITKQGTNEPKTITNETGTFAYKDLEKATRYNIEVIAEDSAGNKTSSITYAITEGGTGGNTGGDTPTSRPAPEVKITKGEGTPDPVGGYYKGSIKIEITDTGSSNLQPIHYIITNEMGSKVKEETIVTGTTNINFNTDGNYKIEAYPCKEDGTKAGESYVENFSIDTTAPNMPVINLLGTIGTNTWYKSEIQVTITPVNDMTSGIKGVQYYVTGDNPITGEVEGSYVEVETADSTTINITTDGKSVIHARTVDNAGNISDVKQTDAWKDSAPPEAVNLSLGSKTENSVTVNISGTGTDETSGIAKYVFEYKLSTAGTWSTAVEPVALPSTYTYTGLTPETAYNFRVRAVDNAGNESTGTGVDETTEAEKIIYVQDKDGVNVPIPKDFTPTGVEGENDIDSGFVIKDTDYNEWVWVPVKAGTLNSMYTNVTATLSGGTGVTTSRYTTSASLVGSSNSKPGSTSGYREPDLVIGNGSQYDYLNYDSLGYSSLEDMARNMVTDYNTMLDSIKKYGGFYIGRYELSVNGSKRNQVPTTNATWYSLYGQCKNLTIPESGTFTRMVWRMSVGCNM